MRVRTRMSTLAPLPDSFGLAALTPVAVAVSAAWRYAAAKPAASIVRRASGVSRAYIAV